MNHFTRDVTRIGPAPTMARELPVTIANLFFSVIAVAVVVAIRGEVDAVGIGFAAVLGVYTLGRPAWIAFRGDRDESRS